MEPNLSQQPTHRSPLSSDLCTTCHLQYLTHPKICTGQYNPENEGRIYQKVNIFTSIKGFLPAILIASSVVIICSTTVIPITSLVLYGVLLVPCYQLPTAGLKC